MISDVEKTLQKAKGWAGGSENDRKKFGVGGPAEASCEMFRAFLVCKGYLRHHRKAVELPAGSTVGDARLKFGPMRQTKILDEDGYQLDETSPLWRYSKDCNISLLFDYDEKTEWELAKRWVQTKIRLGGK